jgi:cobalamin-dependent methionine synthase I
MIANDLESTLKEAAVAYLEVITHHLSGGTEKVTKSFGQGNLCFG